MVNEYWDLNRKPFSNTPDLDFLFRSDEFEEGYARLLYNITEICGGLTLITGEIGSGKTFLAYALKEHLKKENGVVSIITNPKLSSMQLLKTILRKLGKKDVPRYKIKVLNQLEELLVDLNNENRPVIAMIDEAQILSLDALREIRLLLNIETSEKKLLQLVLFGQPDLKEKIERFPQLKQRINIRFHLEPLTREETNNYVKHRLLVSGTKREIFKPAALDILYKRSKGLPRLINNIAQNALFVSCAEGVKKVGPDIIESVADDLEI